MDTRIWLVLMTLLQHCYLKKTDECPEVKYCVCHKHKMYCDWRTHHNHLKTIPRAPPSIVEVHLTNIQLGEVTRTMVSNLTHCKMTSLYLKDNNMSHISPDAFQDLSYLRILDWEQEDLPIVAIEAMLLNVTSDLQTLRLKSHNVHIAAMNASVFQNLKQLKSLTISLKELEIFDASALSTMVNLEKLDLSNNLLHSITFRDSIPNITHLNLAGNNFASVPGLCRVDLLPVTPRLINLQLEANAIRQLNVSSLTCLHNLMKLSLNYNRIEVLQDNVFVNLPKLQSLQLSHMSYLKRIEHFAFNSTSILKLYFSSNPALSTKNFYPGTLFSHTPNLSFLDMSHTKMDIDVSELKALLLNLKNIGSLILQDTHMRALPDGVFFQLKRLYHLVLSGNYFSGWNGTVFANVTHITSIVLAGSNIKTINESSFPLEFRLSVKVIDLSDNPYSCTCDLLWFRNWMKDVINNKSIAFLQYPRRYKCSGSQIKRLLLEDFNPTVKSCTPIALYVILLATVLPITVLAVVTTVVLYRYRWYLLYWKLMILKRKCPKSYDLIREYDAFVSYSNPDYDWVEKELLDFLEPKGMKLLEHNRDFQAGKLIVDNVLDAMDTSRKTILVISNEYMKSSWCQFEMQMAFNGSLKNEFKLVVILLEPIKARQMTSMLRALMTSTTYLKWPADEGVRPLFQQRLEDYVRE